MENIEVLYARFRAANCSFILELEEKWYRVNDRETGQRQFVAADPDGYLLRFCQAIV